MKLYKSTDGPISRYVNRKISARITNTIIKYGIPLTPNQVSLISFLVGITASIIYIAGNPLAAGVLVQASSIIDGVDGELARALNRVSNLGAFLDAILDRVVDVSVIISISYFILTHYSINEPALLLASLLAITGDVLVSYIHARGEASLKMHPAVIGKIPNFSSRDVRLFIIFTASLINQLYAALILISLISYTYIILKTIDVLISYKEVVRK